MDKDLLLSWLKDEGFDLHRILNPLSLLVLSGLEMPPPEAKSAVLVFFPYRCEEADSVVKSPWGGNIAPFAHSNHYKEVVARLKRVVRKVRESEGLRKSEVSIFCNSSYPEKQMAWACGLGTIGKNSLILSKQYGSLGVIGGFFLPLSVEGDSPLEGVPYESCSSCRACVKHCPAGAIKESGGIMRELCYQHLATYEGVLSPEIMDNWPGIIYGCQICQDVCPINRNTSRGISCERGVLGAQLDLSFLLRSSDEELKDFLKGTALGLSWIPLVALRRNALLCLFAKKEINRDEEILIEECITSDHLILKETAKYIVFSMQSEKKS